MKMGVGMILALALLLVAVAPASAQVGINEPNAVNNFLAAPLDQSKMIILDAMQRVVPVAMFIMSVLIGTQIVVRLIRTVLH
jgi:hypothetical protein